MEFWNALTTLLDKGGFVAPPLVVSAIVVWYSLGYRAFMLLVGNPEGIRELVARARSGQIARPRGALERAAMKGVNVLDAPRSELGPFLEEIVYEESAELGRFSKLATSLVQAAPLLGLLGTVTGMIETFDSLGSATLVSQTGGGVAGGISEALFSTQMGLVVAVPGLLIGRMLDRKQRVVEDKLIVLRDVLEQEANA